MRSNGFFALRSVISSIAQVEVYDSFGISFSSMWNNPVALSTFSNVGCVSSRFIPKVSCTWNVVAVSSCSCNVGGCFCRVFFHFHSVHVRQIRFFGPFWVLLSNCVSCVEPWLLERIDSFILWVMLFNVHRFYLFPVTYLSESVSR